MKITRCLASPQRVRQYRLTFDCIMSDGNFNRALLPSTPYRSGVRMGQQQARAKAQDALRTALDEARPTLTDEQKQSVLTAFCTKLSELLVP